MRIARSSVLGVVLLAARTGGAEEGVSLESARQELRQLESTQKSKAGSLVPDRVKLDTPALHLEAAASPAAALATERKKEDDERARRLKQQKDNWLVNGVERLAREDSGAATSGVDDSAGLDASLNTADPADPQYLLKLFDQQEKRSAAKETVAKQRSSPAPDPFAPFLQDWLGSSPVRNQVIEQFRKSGNAVSTTSAPARTTDFPAPAAANPTAGPAPFATSTPTKSNPYLVDSGFSTPTREVTGGPISLPPAMERNALNPAPVPVPAAPVASPTPETRAPAKGPPPNPAEDKKYFPQLDRF